MDTWICVRSSVGLIKERFLVIGITSSSILWLNTVGIIAAHRVEMLRKTSFCLFGQPEIAIISILIVRLAEAFKPETF